MIVVSPTQINQIHALLQEYPEADRLELFWAWDNKAQKVTFYSLGRHLETVDITEKS
jgi:hypothetical protein